MAATHAYDAACTWAGMYDVRIVLQCVSPDQMALAPRVERYYQGQYVRLLCRARGMRHGRPGPRRRRPRGRRFDLQVRRTGNGTVYMAVRCEGLEPAMM